MPRKKVVIEEEEEQPIPESPVKKVRKPRAQKPSLVVNDVELTQETKPVKRTKKTAVDRPATPVVQEPKPKKTSKWLSALKEYNKDKERYIIPKKGTGEYDEVRKMMENMTV